MAVGMPHSATWIGSTSMPASRRKVVISTMAPKATKMSSPKKRPTLSVAAEKARSLWRTLSDSLPWRASAAPSAIGASSGRTICGCPPRLVRPMAAVSWRAARYTISRRPAVAERMLPIQFCACWRSPCRSSRPITASGSRMISGRLRVLMKPVPMAARIRSSGNPAAKAVAIAVTITTSIGLKRRTNPATMTATPTRGHRLTSLTMMILGWRRGGGAVAAALPVLCRTQIACHKVLQKI